MVLPVEATEPSNPCPIPRGWQGKIEVLMDGGVRRGTDILKALSLGAKAVLIGRPILWGLASGGEQGVCKVLSLLREEYELALMLSGCPSSALVDSTIVRGHHPTV